MATVFARTQEKFRVRFYIQKILDFLVTLFLVTAVTFLTFNLLPGNPALAILGTEAEPAQIQLLEEKLGLDKPVSVRYLLWVQDALHGNLGESYQYGQSVSKLISGSFSATAGLAFLSFVLTVIFGVFFGILFSRMYENAFFRPLVSLSQIWFSVPSFCTALFLIVVFSVKLKLLPAMGYAPISGGFLKWLRALILPALSISLGSGAVLARYILTSILAQKKQDYVRTARSKGLRENQIVMRHILRNALIPSITTLGLITADILGGSIIIETVFSIPGIGRLVATSISSRDFPLIQGLVLYLAVIALVCNFVVDILYSIADPRIRKKR